jgi:lambda repressor-like predicted transcriptional regulator
MKSRGKDLNSFGARNYAMRGITVCERWANSFESFLADVGPCPSPKHSIDRVDNEKGYEPGNVRWATSEQQNNNKRSNRKITVNGVTKTLAQWCREAGISSLTFYARLHKGWRIQDAASFPPTRRKITVNGITKPVTQWLREAGIAYSTLSARLERGWSEEEAVTTPPLPAGKKKIV